MIRRMLIVDDEETIRWALRELFMQEGWVVDGAADGNEAVRKVEENAYDFLITDLKMPGVSGVEVVRRARRANPAAGVMVLTGYASLETAVEALRLRAWDYVTKPCEIRYLRERIEAFVRESSGHELRAASRAPLTAQHVDEFLAGAGTPVLALSGLDPSNGIAHALDNLRGVLRDMGLRQERTHNLTQGCVEALALLADGTTADLRAAMLHGYLLVGVRAPGSAQGRFADRLGSHFGLDVRFVAAGDVCNVVLCEGI